MSDNISISIIVPCYNQAQYLDECLQSVLNQTYKNWECIIVNDGSPDNTEEVAKKWLAKDKRFKYLYKENGGLSSARNAGVEISVGEFILPLDSDDKISRNYIEFAVIEFSKDDNLKIVYSKAEKFGLEMGIWDLPDFSLKTLCFENMIFCSGIYKKSDFDIIGGYDPNMIYGLEDWEFWINLLKNGGGVHCINKIHFFYRIKDLSMIKSVSKIEHERLLEYISIKHADFYVKQFGSFHSMNKKLRKSEKRYNKLTKSKKSVLNLFLKTFFGFKLFKN